MNNVVSALLARLTYGTNKKQLDEPSNGFVETLAKAYERARNALEYRADNLVRRAAIERILKRLILLYKDPDEISENLLNELRWAKYLDKNQTKNGKVSELSEILRKYTTYEGTIPHEWVIKIASAEIEEHFNLNKDYNQFTFFAFQVLKQKVQIEHNNLELLVYFAVDKVYAASDPEQIAYHIISLAGQNIDKSKMEEGWDLFNQAQKDKLLPRLNKYVRKSMPPLVLLRDMYFYSPEDFKDVLSDSTKFDDRATQVLSSQLGTMSTNIKRAGIRSIVYVFLTKMIFAFGIETPLESLIYRRIALIPLAINLLFPPLLMWIATMRIKTPSVSEQENLKKRTFYIVSNFADLKNEEDNFVQKELIKKTDLTYSVFSVIYALVFAGIFILIYYLLDLLGFKLFSKFVFIFFLTIVAFFAYKISQIAHIYSWKDPGPTSTITDMVSLPILTIGSILSQGLSRLNFLGFIFDFILEAPFKLILGFVDDWVQFLSVKKEEQILE